MTNVLRQRVLPVLLTAIVVGLCTAYFYYTERTLRDDKALVLVIVVSWILASLQMLIGTARWTLRSLALLTTFVGLVAFFGSFTLALWGLPDPGPWVDALYRGCFVVGAPLILVYSLRWQVTFVRRHVAGGKGGS